MDRVAGLCQGKGVQISLGLLACILPSIQSPSNLQVLILGVWCHRMMSYWHFQQLENPFKQSANFWWTSHMSIHLSFFNWGTWSWNLKVIWKQHCVIEVILYRIVLLAFIGKVKQHRTAIKFQDCIHPCLIMYYCNRKFTERLDF